MDIMSTGGPALYPTANNIIDFIPFSIMKFCKLIPYAENSPCESGSICFLVSHMTGTVGFPPGVNIISCGNKTELSRD